MDRIASRTLRGSAGIALLCAAALSLTATAVAAADPPARRVSISDLNLASPQGKQTFERRVRVAIDQVCAPVASTGGPIVAKQKFEQCRLAARADVQRQLEQHGMTTLLATTR